MARQLTKLPTCACPTDGVIELIGKKWTLCLVATIGNREPVRFNRLQQELEGVSPKTLSDTLAALQTHGIVTRHAFAEVPPRVEYSLTAKGRRLLAAVAPLMEWASAHGEQSVCCA
ncbi:MAG: helix-turn-helix domain-containing protein [bacterium]